MHKFICPTCHVHITVKEEISFNDGDISDRMYCDVCGRKMDEVGVPP